MPNFSAVPSRLAGSQRRPGFSGAVRVCLHVDLAAVAREERTRGQERAAKAVGPMKAEKAGAGRHAGPADDSRSPAPALVPGRGVPFRACGMKGDVVVGARRDGAPPLAGAARGMAARGTSQPYRERREPPSVGRRWGACRPPAPHAPGCQGQRARLP